MTARACLPEPPCDCWMVTSLPGLRLPLRGEGGVHVLVQLARRVVGDVEDLLGARRGRRDDDDDESEGTAD